MMDVTGMFGAVQKGCWNLVMPWFKTDFGIGMGILGVILLAFWIWMIVDCAQRKFKGNEKIVWMLVIIFTKFLGAIIYFFVVKARDKK